MESLARLAAEKRHQPRGHCGRVMTWVIRCLTQGDVLWEMHQEGRMPSRIGRFLRIDPVMREPAHFDAVRRQLDERLAENGRAGDDADAERFAALERLGRQVGLSAAEREILALFALSEIYTPLELALHDAMEASHGARIETTVAAVLELDPATVRRALKPDGTLIRSGLLEVSPNAPGRLPIDCLPGLAERLAGGHYDVAQLLGDYLQGPVTTALTPDDFPHLQEDIARLAAVIRHALAHEMPGVNILIHGPPGVGKTELVRVIAQASGCRLFAVSDAEDGRAVTGRTRARAGSIAQILLANGSDSVLLFDEVEDLFNDAVSSSNDHVPKGWMTRLLDTNPTPTFWVSNRIDGIDRAYRRRMDDILRLGAPPRELRRNLAWAACRDVSPDPGWVEAVADHDGVTPGNLHRAGRVGRMVQAEQGQAAAQRACATTLNHQLAAQGFAPVAASRPPAPRYDISHLAADRPLEDVITGVLATGRGRLLLHGAPGTGKSAFGRHLAEQAGRPLVARTISDLLRSYLGETEQQIACAFAEATQRGSILLMDEVDSLLADRNQAVRSWEVNQVNEFLNQLDAFPGIFLCTTNRPDALDPAVRRRLDDCIELTYPDAHQRWALFRNLLDALGLAAPRGRAATHLRQRLEAMHQLTPGDFATVARRARLQPNLDSAPAVADELAREHAAKDGPAARIGFL